MIQIYFYHIPRRIWIMKKSNKHNESKRILSRLRIKTLFIHIEKNVEKLKISY